MLNDSVWYADNIELKQWLIYYISRPLVGVWADKEIPRAIFVEGMAKRKLAEDKRAAAIESGDQEVLNAMGEGKDIMSVLCEFRLVCATLLMYAYGEFDSAGEHEGVGRRQTL